MLIDKLNLLNRHFAGRHATGDPFNWFHSAQVQEEARLEEALLAPLAVQLGALRVVLGEHGPAVGCVCVCVWSGVYACVHLSVLVRACACLCVRCLCVLMGAFMCRGSIHRIISSL